MPILVRSAELFPKSSTHVPSNPRTSCAVTGADVDLVAVGVGDAVAVVPTLVFGSYSRLTVMTSPTATDVSVAVTYTVQLDGSCTTKAKGADWFVGTAVVRVGIVVGISTRPVSCPWESKQSN